METAIQYNWGIRMTGNFMAGNSDGRVIVYSWGKPYGRGILYGQRIPYGWGILYD